MNNGADMSNVEGLGQSSEPRAADTPSSAGSIDCGKRRRALVACSSCRRRKIRCNSARPRCGNCARADLECHYPVEARRKRTKPADPDSAGAPSSARLHERLDRLEAMLELMLERQGVSFKSENPADALSSDESSIEDESDMLSPYEYSDDDEPQIEGAVVDLFKLSERRAPVVVKLGDSEPLIAYTYGFTPSLLSPKGMRVLCECIGNHSLGERAEAVLSRMWKQKTGAQLEWGKLLRQQEALKPEIILYSMQMHRESTSDLIHSLIDETDLKFVNKLCCPSGDFSKVEYSSPYSLLYPVIVMTCTNSGITGAVSSEFSTECVKSQNSAAFALCLRQMTYMSWAPTTFLLLRLLVLATLSLSQKVLFPQLRGTISLCIYMALNLGLHRSDGSRKLSPEERSRRALVWALIQDIDMKVSSVMSQSPLVVQYSRLNTKKRLSFQPGSDIEHLTTSMDLNNIYLRIHSKLFSPKAQRADVHKLMASLLALDAQLIEWNKSLPQVAHDTMRYVNIKEDIGTGAAANVDCHSRQLFQKFEASLTREGLMGDKLLIWCHLCDMVSYYNMLILIHSIPAFSPSCLRAYKSGEVPPRLLDSLSIISDSARNILKLTFNMKPIQSDSCIAFTATNAFSALFLKQIRDPRHPSNAEDLVLIYRYIAKFRSVTDSINETDAVCTMNVWLIFAQALTQLNKEYPTGTPEVRAQLEAAEKLHNPGYEANDHRRTKLNVHAAKQQQQQQQPQQQEAPMSPGIDMRNHIYNPMAPDFISQHHPSHMHPPHPQMHPHQHPHQHPQQPIPQQPQFADSLMPNQMFDAQFSDAPNMAPHNMMPPQMPQMQPPPFQPGQHMPLDQQFMADDPNFSGENPSQQNLESSLWAAFQEAQGIDVAFNDDDIMNGLEPTELLLDPPPNNCTIC